MSDDSSATVTVVAIAAVPVVSWLSVSTAITEFVAVKPEPANKVAISCTASFLAVPVAPPSKNSI